MITTTMTFEGVKPADGKDLRHAVLIRDTDSGLGSRISECVRTAGTAKDLAMAYASRFVLGPGDANSTHALMLTIAADIIEAASFGAEIEIRHTNIQPEEYAGAGA